MKSDQLEKISLLMDGELDNIHKKAVLDALSKKDRLQRCWQDYHLIGDALRKSLPEYLMSDIAKHVSAALEKEPTYFLPSSSLRSHSETSKQTNLSAKYKYATGFALAASFLVTVVLGFQWQRNDALSSHQQQLVSAVTPESAQIADTSPRQAIRVARGKQGTVSQQTVATNSVTSRPQQPRRVAQVISQKRVMPSRLAPYLVNHSEHSFHGPMRGELMPYVRIVGYQSQQR